MLKETVLPPRTNVPEMTVTDLANSLKRTLEETYGRVRVKGELSRVKVHTSGHMYADLKDAQSALNTVCWKQSLSRLSIRPEEGLEVICTGRISTYPSRSNYQLIIESMELAGQGALLKMLEDRRKKLASEGFFDASHKKELPFLPETIGVVTSPTGAVIRDILHRLEDRFPRRVLIWPVLVQGTGAAEQVATAIRGFDALRGDFRPDLLIVARGGGSLEDLMPFNEEIVVRAVAACSIPLIAAIGHETDTTLIDYAADMRAPTPTAAAEMAVPVRAELLAAVLDSQHRMIRGATRRIGELKNRLAAQAARLGDPQRLLELKAQRLDHAAHKIRAVFEKGLSRRLTRAAELGGRLRHPRNLVAEAGRSLEFRVEGLGRVRSKLLTEPKKHLDQTARMLESLSFKGVLRRGYVVVRDRAGGVLVDAAAAKASGAFELEFRENQRLKAVPDPHS